MKNKNTAAILAFLGGVIGLHRFYLGQIGLGVVYAFLALTGVSFLLGLLDGIIFLTMNQQVFDAKYNKRYTNYRVPADTDFQRPNRRQRREMRRRPEPRTRRSKTVRRSPARRKSRVRNNPFKQAGIKKFKEFDIEASIKDFQQALKIDPNDLTIHFNLACAYSQIEEADKAYGHLSQAVEMGFNDFDKINAHDALAYVRIQPQWEEFKTNGYTLRKKLAAPKENLLDNDLLLDQLKKLNELREKGLITEKEFIEQKAKLIRH